MSGPVLISPQTAKDLTVVTGFFGIDMAWNSHLFRYASQVDGRAFEVVMRAMAEAVEQDLRRGVTARVRQSIAREKAKK